MLINNIQFLRHGVETLYSAMGGEEVGVSTVAIASFKFYPLVGVAGGGARMH